MTTEELLALANRILIYCDKFSVPHQYLFEILEDQKVTPMIRGKAMEYNAFILLESTLPRTVWSVQKLNLNAQPGSYDEDVSVTHRRSGVILKIESKSAVRGSISDGTRSRIIREPHFKVKSHRSRSNIELADSSNDRYAVGTFDVILTNPLNAIFKGNTIGENFEVVSGEREMLFQHYNVTNTIDLLKSCANDWRYCIPQDIAENGFIPRTPYVKLNEDPNWRPFSELEHRLNEVVQLRRNTPSRRS